MKIITNTITSPSKSSGDYIKSNKKDISCPEQKQIVDTITIGTSSVSDLSETQFFNVLKHQLASEVKAGASSYKLNDISSQVALGQYEINAVDIVRKMMLDGVEG